MKFKFSYRNIVLVACIFCSLSCNAKTILVLGDSLSAGYGLSPGQGWVDLLSARLAEKHGDYSVVNASVSGETSAEGLQRLTPQLNTDKPQIVILALGSNDGLRNEPMLVLKINLSKIIDLAQAQSAQLLLIGFKLPLNYDPAYRAEFEQAFVDISSKYDLKLVPFLMAGFATDPNYFQADHLHPNANAQPIMLENVWPYLEPMLG